MTAPTILTPARARMAGLLAAVVALWLSHRFVAALAVRDLRSLGSGYTDAEVLAPGGDLALELARVLQTPLRSALVAVGFWLLLGRVPALVAAFFLQRMAVRVVWSGSLRLRPEGTRPLHWAALFPLVLGVTLLGWTLVTALLVALFKLRSGVLRVATTDAAPLLAVAAVILVLAWAFAQVWLDLCRALLASGRVELLAALRLPGLTLLRHYLRLLGARILLGGATSGLALGSVCLLTVVTRGDAPARTWATIAVDLGLLGAICLRAAWLAWVSAHVPHAPAAPVRPASSADDPPGAAPAAPDDPSPDPGASPA